MTQTRVAGVIGLSTVGSAALGWGALLVVANLGGASGYASFAVMWGVYYGFGGSLAGLQHEVMRVTVQGTSAASPHPTRSVGGVALATGVCFAVLGATIAVVLQIFDTSLLVPGLLAVGLTGFAGLVIVLGILAGQERWPAFAGLLMADALLRFLAVLVVMASGGSGNAQMAAIATGSWVWMPLALVPAARQALGGVVTTGIAVAPFVKRAATGMTSSGCASLQIAGFPFLVSVLERGPLPASLAGALAALLLLRSPLLMLTYAYRPLILGRMLRDRERIPSLVWRSWVLCAWLGAAFVTLAIFAGPPALELAFGADFALSGPQAGLCAGGGVFLVMLTLSTLALTALDRHRQGTEAWVISVLGSMLTLAALGVGSSEVLVAASLGPLVGVVWHAVRMIQAATELARNAR